MRGYGKDNPRIPTTNSRRCMAKVCASVTAQGGGGRMIALTDTGLALLAIHATAVPAEKREALLRRLASAADPSPQLRYARRVRAVKIGASIEVDAPLETVGFIPRIPRTKCDGSRQ
jgi:hypothetical protein